MENKEENAIKLLEKNIEIDPTHARSLELLTEILTKSKKNKNLSKAIEIGFLALKYIENANLL